MTKDIVYFWMVCAFETYFLAHKNLLENAMNIFVSSCVIFESANSHLQKYF